MAKRFQIIHEIYENDEEEPTVTHVFHGETPERAEEVYRAHMKTDAFLRGCTQRGRWDGVDCWVEVERVRT